MSAVIVEISLGVGEFNMDRGAELTMVDVDINVQKGDMAGGSVPAEVDRRIATVELFQENSEGPEQEYVIDKPQP